MKYVSKSTEGRNVKGGCEGEALQSSPLFLEDALCALKIRATLRRRLV